MEEVGTPGSLPVIRKKKLFENLEISLRVDRYVSRASNMKDFDENTNPNTFDNSTYQINVFLSIQIRIWLVKIVLITEPTSKKSDLASSDGSGGGRKSFFIRNIYFWCPCTETIKVFQVFKVFEKFFFFRYMQASLIMVSLFPPLP